MLAGAVRGAAAPPTGADAEAAGGDAGGARAGSGVFVGGVAFRWTVAALGSVLFPGGAGLGGAEGADGPDGANGPDGADGVGGLDGVGAAGRTAGAAFPLGGGVVSGTAGLCWAATLIPVLGTVFAVCLPATPSAFTGADMPGPVGETGRAALSGVDITGFARSSAGGRISITLTDRVVPTGGAGGDGMPGGGGLDGVGVTPSAAASGVSAGEDAPVAGNAAGAAAVIRADRIAPGTI